MVHKLHYIAFLPLIRHTANIYSLKFNIRNTRKRCETCSKLTIKTPEHFRGFLIDYVHVTLFIVASSSQKPILLVGIKENNVISTNPFVLLVLRFTYYPVPIIKPIRCKKNFFFLFTSIFSSISFKLT